MNYLNQDDPLNSIRWTTWMKLQFLDQVGEPLKSGRRATWIRSFNYLNKVLIFGPSRWTTWIRLLYYISQAMQYALFKSDRCNTKSIYCNSKSIQVNQLLESGHCYLNQVHKLLKSGQWSNWMEFMVLRQVDKKIRSVIPMNQNDELLEWSSNCRTK